MPPYSQNADADGSGNIFVQIAGDHNSVNLQGHPYLTLVRAQTRVDSATEWASDSVLELLSPYRRDVVPLLNREADFASLEAWLNSPAPISVRVIAGRAGAGKTRFAVEALLRFCADPNVRLGGFLTSGHLASFTRQHDFGVWRWPRPVLAVMDYASASGSHLQTWLRELADLPRQPHALRILLLDRSASDTEGWYRLLLESNPDRPGYARLFEAREDRTLAPLEAVEDRRALLKAMLEGGAKHTGKSVPRLPVGDINFEQHFQQDDLWADPLYVMMAALVGLETGVPHALSLSRVDLAHHLARGERGRLDRFGPREEGARRLRIHVAAAATLVEGLSPQEARDEAAEALGALGLEYPGNHGQCAVDLSRALPRSGGGVAAVVPDIVGGAFVLQTFAGEYRQDGDALIGRLGRRALPALLRAAQDFSTPVRLENTHIVDKAPLEWLAALVDQGEADDLALLIEIDGAMPKETVALRELAARVTRTVYERMCVLELAPEVQQAEQARLVHNLGNRFSDMGRPEEALAATEEATGLYRKLAESRPDAFLHFVAMSLNSLGSRYNELGNRKAALAVTEEAVTLYRKLVATQPDFLPNLAGALNNLGNWFLAVGKLEEALVSAKEAVGLKRQLAAVNPDDFLPSLANTLSNLGNVFSDLERREEALVAAEEAVSLYRRLAAGRPDSFLPDLARSLNNLGNRLSEVHRHEEAIVAAEEAVMLYRRLAQAQPDAFLPYLAGSLSNFGNWLSLSERSKEALNVSEEAVTLHRQLAALRPDAFLPGLASSLTNLGNRFSEEGKHLDALKAGEEAVALYRQLAATQPDAFVPGLALSLTNLGNRFEELGKRTEALTATREAVALDRQLAAVQPDAFLPDLATSLTNLGIRFMAVELLDEAFVAVEEAVAMRRKLAAARPEVFMPDLVRSLGAVGLINLFARREAAAHSALLEGVRLLSPFFLRSPQAFGSLMAAVLRDYLQTTQATNTPPDIALLQPILEKLPRPPANP